MRNENSMKQASDPLLRAYGLTREPKNTANRERKELWMKRIFTFGSLSAGAYFALLLVLPSTCLGDGYPGDYTPSAPAETGNTNILARFGALLTYVNAKLEAAGGEEAPECFRACMTSEINKILECLDQKNTYHGSASCEQDAAIGAAQCNPKCSDS